MKSQRRRNECSGEEDREDLLLSRVSLFFVGCAVITGSNSSEMTTATFETSQEQEAPKVPQLSGEGRADLVFTLRENELWCHTCT